ncbi:hypothetical protein ACLOJK_005294 [Asimina triloba]
MGGLQYIYNVDLDRFPLLDFQDEVYEYLSSKVHGATPTKNLNKENEIENEKATKVDMGEPYSLKEKRVYEDGDAKIKE